MRGLSHCLPLAQGEEERVEVVEIQSKTSLLFCFRRRRYARRTEARKVAVIQEQEGLECRERVWGLLRLHLCPTECPQKKE